MRIPCEPPIDERDDRVREGRQRKALEAVLGGTLFELVCVLTDIPSESPYENYKFPEFGELEFALKGLLRLEMIGDEVALGYRRLMGASKKRWVLPEYAELELPKAWASRVDFKLLKNAEDMEKHLTGCPMRTWGRYGSCQLLDQMRNRADGMFALLQVRDVYLDEKEGKLSDLIVSFTNGRSQIFRNGIGCECLRLGDEK